MHPAAGMARLEQLTEYLFTHPGTSLTLDSEGPGYYVDASGVATPVFKQTLRAGQILLLFAERIPREQSQDFLAGKPVDFVFETKQGKLASHMEMKGSDLKVRVRPASQGQEVSLSGLGFSAQYLVAPSPPPPPLSPPCYQRPPRAALLSIIAQLPERGASHLHLAPDQPAFLRIDGRLESLRELGYFSSSELREALASLAPESIRESLAHQSQTHFEFSHHSKDSVFHVQGQLGREGLGAVVRILPLRAPSPESLGLPEGFLRLLRSSGLLLVSGGPGQGTSTTVASAVQGELGLRPLTVCTLENSADYILEPRKGLVRQLEVGVHASSFAAGLEVARRGDADLVVVGELDQPPTLAGALVLAERGRLVIAVVRARSAVAALQKLLELAPGGAEALATSLSGVFAQSLVSDGKGGRRLSWELLPGSEEVKAFLRDGALAQLPPLLMRAEEPSAHPTHGPVRAA